MSKRILINFFKMTVFMKFVVGETSLANYISKFAYLNIVHQIVIFRFFVSLVPFVANSLLLFLHPQAVDEGGDGGFGECFGHAFDRRIFLVKE